MLGGRIDLRQLAGDVMDHNAPLTRDASELVRLAQLALLEGEPVSMDRIGRLNHLSHSAVTATLLGLPGMARFDGWGRLVGVFGLSVQPTPHRLSAGTSSAYTWCAWDSLFIPRVIGTDIAVASHCPVTGTPVELRVSPEGVSAMSPGEVMVSFLAGRQATGECGLAGACCSHIHFLSDTAAARRWLACQPAGLVLTIEEAWQLGRLFVDRAFACTDAVTIAAPEPGNPG
jgi:alkylmercury lyase